MDDVRLDHEVFVQELPAVNIIGMYATNFGRSEVDMVRLLGFKKGLHRCLVGQVQFTPGAGNDVFVSL